MVTRCVLATIVGFVFTTATPAADNDRQLKVTLARGIGMVESVTVFQTKDGSESVATFSKFDKPVALPNDGPFEVMAKPKAESPCGPSRS